MPRVHPQVILYLRGRRRVEEFCLLNDLLIPSIYRVSDWYFDACAYYRKCQIKIHLPKCAYPATEGQVRNWNWPGSVTDREPYGVLCHELGHHADCMVSDKVGSYGGDYSVNLMAESGESPITSYCPNPWEWFAEMFRLFVTNPALLMAIRPRTYQLLIQKFKAIDNPDWIKELGPNVPDRILNNLKKKVH